MLYVRMRQGLLASVVVGVITAVAEPADLPQETDASTRNLSPPLPPISSVRNPKRGFVADGTSCNDAIALNVSGWFYDYNVDNRYTSPSATGDCVAAEKVPYKIYIYTCVFVWCVRACVRAFMFGCVPSPVCMSCCSPCFSSNVVVL